MKKLFVLVALIVAAAGCSGGDHKAAPAAAQPSLAVAPTAAPTSAAPPASPAALRECSAFSTQAAANDYLRATPAAKANLDTDGDGVACEAKFAPAKPKATSSATGSRKGCLPYDYNCDGFVETQDDPGEALCGSGRGPVSVCGTPYPVVPDYSGPQTRQYPGTPATDAPPGYHPCGVTGAICPDE